MWVVTAIVQKGLPMTEASTMLGSERGCLKCRKSKVAFEQPISKCDRVSDLKMLLVWFTFFPIMPVLPKSKTTKKGRILERVTTLD